VSKPKPKIIGDPILPGDHQPGIFGGRPFIGGNPDLIGGNPYLLGGVRPAGGNPGIFGGPLGSNLVGPDSDIFRGP